MRRRKRTSPQATRIRVGQASNRVPPAREASLERSRGGIRTQATSGSGATGTETLGRATLTRSLTRCLSPRSYGRSGSPAKAHLRSCRGGQGTHRRALLAPPSRVLPPGRTTARVAAAMALACRAALRASWRAWATARRPPPPPPLPLGPPPPPVSLPPGSAGAVPRGRRWCSPRARRRTQRPTPVRRCSTVTRGLLPPSAGTVTGTCCSPAGRTRSFASGAYRRANVLAPTRATAGPSGRVA
mmetsp:Transcript_12578/g.35319  ORF Transcript_12578/g.35319 Transcript_12578/m.35319 type:complete len:243 (+) Transcript_12578:324-1052(+)